MTDCICPLTCAKKEYGSHIQSDTLIDNINRLQNVSTPLNHALNSLDYFSGFLRYKNGKSSSSFSNI